MVTKRRICRSLCDPARAAADRGKEEADIQGIVAGPRLTADDAAQHEELVHGTGRVAGGPARCDHKRRAVAAVRSPARLLRISRTTAWRGDSLAAGFGRYKALDSPFSVDIGHDDGAICWLPLLTHRQQVSILEQRQHAIPIHTKGEALIVGPDHASGTTVLSSGKASRGSGHRPTMSLLWAPRGQPFQAVARSVSVDRCRA